MNKWRPACWKNPHGTTEFRGDWQLDADIRDKTERAKAFEAGADAMLEALRNDYQVETLAKQNHKLGDICPGKVVLIPDDGGEKQ